MIPDGIDPFDWARKHLRASSGAVLMNPISRDTYRIPTLVPARKEDLSCIYLDGKDRCTIHQSAPFACAFFDSHNDGHDLSLKGLMQIKAAHADELSVYHRIWMMLSNEGLVAIPPEKAREMMQGYMDDQEKQVPWWKRKGKRIKPVKPGRKD
jgi:Fe-S-cluster containining protein